MALTGWIKMDWTVGHQDFVGDGERFYTLLVQSLGLKRCQSDMRSKNECEYSVTLSVGRNESSAMLGVEC